MKKHLFLFLSSLLICASVQAQNLNGNPTPQMGVAEIYYYTSSTLYTSYTFIITSGTGVINGMDHQGNNYGASVTWTGMGPGTLKFYVNNGTTLLGQINVTVMGCTTTAVTPSVTLSVAVGCGSSTVSYPFGTNPPAGNAWYWQTSSTGTSFASPATSSTWTVTSTTTLYLRSYVSCNGTWSGALSTGTITVNPVPAQPAAFTISTNTCGPKTLTKTGTIPGTDTWYWQGQNSNGTDTSPANNAANFPTYSAQFGGLGYYLRAVRNGCWSTPYGAAAGVNNPAAPNANAFTYCEWDPMALTTTGYGTNLRWYTTSDQLIQTGTTYTPQVKIGNYTFKVKSVNGSCESISSANVTLNVATCDDYLNWTQSTAYSINTDGSPKIIASSKNYTNSRGELLQSQTKNYSANSVMANQPIYDRNNKPSAQTLEAPINSSTFGYRYRFVTNQNSPSASAYGPDDFDKLPTVPNALGEVYNPKPVGNDGIGSLGWYYSSSNTLEPLTPQTSYPYVRTYTPDEPDAKVSYSAGAAFLNMGSGHVAKSEKRLITGELDNYFLLRPQFISAPISANPNLLGSLATTSTSGFTPYLNVSVTSVSGYITATLNQTGGTPGIWPIGGNIAVTPGKKYILRIKGFRANGNTPINPMVTDVAGTTTIATGPAFPGGAANEAWVDLAFTVPAGVTSIRVGARWANPTSTSQQFKISAVDLRCSIPTVPIGYESILTDQDGTKSAIFVDADGHVLAKALIVSGTDAASYIYDNWSYNFYNDMGQLMASIAPNGLTGGTTSSPTFVTTYKYDHLGRTIEVNSTDQGRIQVVYSTDGKIRFSQNQEQYNSSPKRFSYTNYDYLGRPVESGEYTMSGSGYYVFEPNSVSAPSGNSVLNIVDNNVPQGVDIETITSANFTGPSEKTDSTRCSDYTYMLYDRQSTSFLADALHSAQNNLQGHVSMMQSKYGTTFYSYDELDRTQWTRDSVIDLGYKNIDYTYDFSGNVTDVAYQKGKSEQFYHHYTYDTDLRLIEVRTSLNGTTKTLHATYSYFLHGPLKRIELASSSCKQGIDYVYTANGQLKAINSNNPSGDPGLDGISGPNASNPKDFFGETLHYSAGEDYTGAGYDAGSITIDSQYPKQYGGRIQAISYNNTTDLNIGGNGNARHIYGFQYDGLGQLKTASWGSVSGTVATFGEAQRENIGAYDKNGNVQSLLRKGKAGTATADYTYVYEPNTNKLDKITQAGTNVVDYTYNAVGQMTKQDEGSSKILQVSYNADGLVKDVRNNSGQLMQTYTYNERGDLVRRSDYNANVLIKTTYFVRDMTGTVVAIYNRSAGGTTSRIEVPIYGAGRIGIYKPATSTYLYEATDHLGNVRAVCELSTRVDTYTATMETENAGSEEPPFKNVAATRATYINANHTPTAGAVTGNEAVKLNNVKPAGPAIVLPVSPGDKIDMDAWAYYEGSGTTNPIAEATMITKIAAAFGGVSGGAGESGQIYNRVNAALTGTLGSSSPFPAAFLTCIVYDKNYVKEFFTSTAVPTGGSMVQQHVTASTVTIEKPGYVYICLINRSDDINPVYFDDFVVKQTHGPIVAGSDYYPFGLVMDGTQVTDRSYRYGYQGQYSEKDSLSGWNEFNLRMYDARFGRWLGPDPYGQFTSPYVGMGNNPVSGVDPNGGLVDLPEVIVTATRFGSVAGQIAGQAAMRALSYAITDKFKYSTQTQSTTVERDNSRFNEYYINDELVGKTLKGGPTRGVFHGFDDGTTVLEYWANPNYNWLSPWLSTGGAVVSIWGAGTDIVINGPKPMYTGAGDWAKMIKAGTGLSKKLGYAGATITAADIWTNGLNFSNGLDAYFTGVSLLGGGYGAGVGGAYFGGNLIHTGVTGKSFGQYLEDEMDKVGREILRKKMERQPFGPGPRPFIQ